MVTGISQTPSFCFLDGILQGVFQFLIGGIEVFVDLPPESTYPTVLTLALPFLGNLDTAARFENGEIVFDEVDLEPIHRVDSAECFPPDFQ